MIVTDFLEMNALGRDTSVRLGMSKRHSYWMRITLKSDVMRLHECETMQTIITIPCSECCEFGQV